MILMIVCRQGLMLAWAFNQYEAANAFRLAISLDSNASMPYWGVSYALGPGANRSVWPFHMCRGAASKRFRKKHLCSL
jgi:hypothetical protein